MATERRAGRASSRRYSDAQKAQAVRLVRALRAELGTDHGTVRRVADQLGFGVESVRKWVRQADIDDGDAAGTTTADRGRIWELEQENRELRRANAILKSANICPSATPKGSPPTTSSPRSAPAVTATTVM